jgi:hypothetical protein
VEDVAKSLILAPAEPPARDPGQKKIQPLREIDFLRNVKALGDTARNDLAYRVQHELIGKPEDGGAAGAHVVDVTHIVDVEDPGAFGLVGDQHPIETRTQDRY